MRALLAIGGMLVVTLAISPGGHAQRALRDGQPAKVEIPARGLFTLRPEAGLEPLAAEVAAVLELRTGARVEVGEAPPPGLLEAVPAGHVAIARRGGGLQIVLGAVGGQSFATRIELRDGLDAADARALALAVESLHDSALDRSHDTVTDEPDAEEAAETPQVSAATPFGTPEEAAAGARPDAPQLHDEGAMAGDFWKPRFLREVEPFAFARLYSGASAHSSAVESGLGGGLGVCAEGQCLVLGAELPLSDAETTDLRYRYMTYSAVFYSRPEPLRFGDFVPGSSLGLLTRVGRFNDDMGLEDEGVDTDLAARGSVELAWLAADHVDLMLEGGADYLLDRFLLSDRRGSVSRGDRLTPWIQAAVRVRPR